MTGFAAMLDDREIAAPAQLSRREFLVAACIAGAAVTGCASGRAVPGAARQPGLGVIPGYAPGARLLIINADDIGISRSVNAAVTSAFERQLIVSGSMMVPCAYFPEFAAWARTHRDLDLGVHLTFTSLPSDKIRPVLPAAQVPSLVDGDGFFPVRWPVERVVAAAEVHAEIIAQVARAKELGIEPTHIDGHQHLVQLRGADVYAALVQAASETRLPFRLARNWEERAPYILTNMKGTTVPLERMIAMVAGVSAQGWAAWYAAQIRAIPPGLSELFMHPGYDTAELRSLLPDANASGPSGRQRDYDALGSDELRSALRESGVIRVTWRDVGRALARG